MYILYFVLFLIRQAPELNLIISLTLKIQSVNPPESGHRQPFSYQLCLIGFVTSENAIKAIEMRSK